MPIQLTRQRQAPDGQSFQNEKRIDTAEPARPGGFLIADLPIRNARNPSTINKNSVSNRQKNGLFLTARLRPQRERIFLILPAGILAGQLPRIKKQRNSMKTKERSTF